jgi:hypothetical protein
MNDRIAARRDATLDTIALLKATIQKDTEAITAILENTELDDVIGVLTALFLEELGRTIADPIHYLDAYRQFIEARSASGGAM